MILQTMAMGALAAAQTSGDSPALASAGIAALLVFLPFVAIAGTSFLKIALVLSILRSALGAPSVPPSAVITALAAVLSAFVMAPVASEMMAGLSALSATPALGSDLFGLHQAAAVYDAVAPPLVDFLRQNTPSSEVEFFAGLAQLPSGSEASLRVLLPAFAIGELVEAFAIGLLVFLPFLVIDLIVANTLLALGMHMLSPTAVALPLKLLLFVAVDGWHIVISGLLVSYGT